MKMRYKVNFHVLLYFLSSWSTMMGSQASNILSHNDGNNNANDTQVANTFLINVNNNMDANDDSAASQHTTHLASTNDRIPTALASNTEAIQTMHPQIRAGKFYR